MTQSDDYGERSNQSMNDTDRIVLNLTPREAEDLFQEMERATMTYDDVPHLESVREKLHKQRSKFRDAFSADRHQDSTGGGRNG